MSELRTPTSGPSDRRGTNEHSLVAVEEYIPGNAPTDYDIELGTSREYLTRFWRCQYCGQERNRRDEFDNACEGEPKSLLGDGGYSVEDARTRRALTEAIDVEFGVVGPHYPVTGERGKTYEVNVDDRTCSCPDYQKRAPTGGCKHVRRAVLEIQAGQLPGPDGTFHR